MWAERAKFWRILGISDFIGSLVCQIRQHHSEQDQIEQVFILNTSVGIISKEILIIKIIISMDKYWHVFVSENYYLGFAKKKIHWSMYETL